MDSSLKPSKHHYNPEDYDETSLDEPQTPVVTPPPILPGDGAPTKHRNLKSIVSTLLILISAPLIAIALTVFVFQSYEVDGPSMEPALQDNDRLIVLKLPRTWAKITGDPYVPHRGDIVIFNARGEFSFDPSYNKQLVKRVVGLPGERVVIRDGKVTVYNRQHPGGFNPDESLPYGKTIRNTSGNNDIVVPDNEVYVLGDNRANSLDSRALGPVPVNDIVGKLGIRLFPISKIKKF